MVPAEDRETKERKEHFINNVSIRSEETEHQQGIDISVSVCAR